MAGPQSLLPLAAFVQRHVKSSVDGRPTTISYDVRGRWDVDGENGIVIGSTSDVDVSSCLERTNVDWTPPTS